MKKILLISFIILSITSLSFAQKTNDRSKQVSDKSSSKKYIPLSNERFNEIESLMKLQDDWNPIRIKDIPKNELVAFYIKSYDFKTVSTWVDFAYEKLQKLNMIISDSSQDKKLKKILILPKTPENMFQFMMLMSTEQIETVGY